MNRSYYIGLFLLLVFLLAGGAPQATAQCSGNCEDGIGELRYKTGNIYKGHFSNGLPHGRGILKLRSGSRFQGYFRKGKLYHGNYHYHNGDLYKGYFKDNKRDGLGRMVTSQGETFEGRWEQGKLRKAEPYVGPNIGQTYVFIVSVNHNLNYTDEDARLFRQMAMDYWQVPAENIRYLADEQALRQNVLRTGLDLFGHSYSADRVIFYFSGHGNAQGLLLQDGVMRFEDIKALFRAAPALEKFCFVDACHSAALNDGSAPSVPLYVGIERSLKGATPENNEKGGPAQVILFFSSRSSERSAEIGVLGHGLFTYSLCNTLGVEADANGDAIVSVLEWFQAMRHKLRSLGGEQNPVLRGQFSPEFPMLNLSTIAD